MMNKQTIIGAVIGAVVALSVVGGIVSFIQTQGLRTQLGNDEKVISAQGQNLSQVITFLENVTQATSTKK